MDPKERIKKYKEVSLTQSEKDEIRERLVTYMELKPHRAPVSPEQEQSIFSFLHFSYRFVATFLLVIFLGTGFVVASEQSLPGDTLYPMKISVNENVRELFALTPQAKATLQLELLNRRLGEAQRLARENKLDDEKIAYIKTQIEKHVTDEQTEAAKVQQDEESKDPDVIALKVEGMIRAHEKALESYAAKDPSNEEGAEEHVQTIDDGEETGTTTDELPDDLASSVLVPLEELPEVTTASERKTRDRKNLAEKEVAHTTLFVNEHEQALTDDEEEMLREELDLLEDLIESGETDFKTGAFLLASRKFKYVILLSEEVKSTTLIFSRNEETLEEVQGIDEATPTSTDDVSEGAVDATTTGATSTE